MSRFFARARDERGSVTVEYVLMIMVGAAAIAVVLAVVKGPEFAGAVRDMFLRNLG